MVNSAIVKLSKLTVAGAVYRGVSGGVLPPSFWEANEDEVSGGVEFAFMSTTRRRDVAVEYASRLSAVAIILEVNMGMIDRGASVRWLSQYPHEEEILFNPLTGLEVQGTRVEGSALVVQVRLSVNLTALTIEQVGTRPPSCPEPMARRLSCR